MADDRHDTLEVPLLKSEGYQIGVFSEPLYADRSEDRRTHPPRKAPSYDIKTMKGTTASAVPNCGTLYSPRSRIRSRCENRSPALANAAGNAGSGLSSVVRHR